MTTTKSITNAWTNRTLPDIFYEEAAPIEEGMLQETPMRNVINALIARFQHRDDVFISNSVFISYDMTDGNRRVLPDCFLAFGVDAKMIRLNLPNYWVWEIGKMPDFVMEVASPSTAAYDIAGKRDLYARLGISEYWRFDPTGGELYGQPLMGEHLVEGRYQPYSLHTEDDGRIWAYSDLLDVNFQWDREYGFDVIDPEGWVSVDPVAVHQRALQVERDARLAAESREQQLLDEIARLRQATQ